MFARTFLLIGSLHNRATARGTWLQPSGPVDAVSRTTTDPEVASVDPPRTDLIEGAIRDVQLALDSLRRGDYEAGAVFLTMAVDELDDAGVLKDV
jgi:hypothetical protein